MARRAVIDRDELIETANTMAAEGRPVTALALLEALGGGSLTTIYKYLSEWEAARPKSAPAGGATELPDNVQNAFMSTWRVATMEAARETAAAKEKAAEEVKAAQSKFDEALQGIQRLEAQTEQDSTLIETLKARVAELEQLVSNLSNDNAGLKATAEQLRHQVKSQQADHATAQNKATEQLERLRGEASELQKKSEQLERDRQAAQLKLEQADKLAQASELSREQANKERETAVKEAAELKGQAEAMKAQNTQLLAALAEPRQSQEKPKGKPTN